MTHSELEQFLNQDGRELLRLMLQAHLDERAPGEVSEPVIDAIREISCPRASSARFYQRPIGGRAGCFSLEG